MNEMLRSLGFGQVNANKWTNGSSMTILVCSTAPIHCIGAIGELSCVEYVVEKSDTETMKHHIEKFMRMVGKCIQVDDE